MDYGATPASPIAGKKQAKSKKVPKEMMVEERRV
jgi:hypothetical protein